MISVTLDEEIIVEFKNKFFGTQGIPEEGARFYLDTASGRHPFWVDEAGNDAFTIVGPDELRFVFDSEFTEWLKEHRPEVFL